MTNEFLITGRRLRPVETLPADHRQIFKRGRLFAPPNTAMPDPLNMARPGWRAMESGQTNAAHTLVL